MADEKVLIEFDLEFGDSQKDVDRLTTSVIENTNSLKANRNEQKKLSKSEEDQTQAIKKLQQEEFKLKDRLSDLNRERKKAVDITKIQANTLEGLRKQTSALFREREKINTSTKEGSKRFQELTNKIKSNSAAIRKADQAAGSFHTSIGKYPKVMGAAIGKMVAMAGGFMLLIKGIKNAFNTIKDFEKAMDKLQAVTKATDEEINLLRGDALRLGSSTSKTASEVAELQTEFAKLGFTTKEIRDVTEATIELSIAAGSDLAQSAIVAGATIRGFGLDTSKTQRVVDVMAKSFSSSALDINKFQTAMATVAPVASSSNISLERTTATLGKLNDAGLDASTSGTGLRNVYLELSKQGITLDKALDKIENSTDKNKTAMELFGKRGATVGIIMANTRDEIDELTKSLENSEGAAKEMAATMEDNLQGDINKLSSAWEGLVLSMDSGGGVISQTIRSIVTGFTDFINILNLANKTAEEIKLDEKLKALGEQTKLDVDEFKEFNSHLKETDKSFENLSKRAETFLEVDKKRLEILKETEKADDIQIAILETRIEAINTYLKSVKSAEEKIIKAEREGAEKRAEQTKEFTEEQLEKLEEANEEIQGIKAEIAEEEIEAKVVQYQTEQELKEAADQAEIESEQRKKEQIIEIRNELFQNSKKIFGLISQSLNASLKNEEVRANRSFSRRQKQLKESFERGEITQEEFDTRSLQLEKDKQLALYRIEKERFETNKKIALLNVAIDIAGAVAKVWAQTGIGGIVAQALPIAAGLIQASIIAGQEPPPPPEFAEGGDVKSGILGGMHHSAGGVNFSGSDGTKFTAEKDEGIFITKRRATAEALSYINQKYGGRSFFDSPGRFFASGGSVIGTGENLENMTRAIRQALKGKIVVQVEDIQTGLIDYNEVINEGVVE